MIALDTNILVYAVNDGATQHEVARGAIRTLIGSGTSFGVPVFAVGEFLRVVTHPRVPAGSRNMGDAVAFVDRLLGAPGARLLSPGPRYWGQLQDALTEGGASGNVVFDAQIVAVSLEHGADTILTEDKGLRRFGEIRVTTLAEFAA